MFNDSIENVDKLTELLNIVYAPEGTWNSEGKLKLTSVSISQPIYTTDQCYRYGYSYAYSVKATLDYDGHTMTHIYRIPKELDHGIISIMMMMVVIFNTFPFFRFPYYSILIF